MQGKVWRGWLTRLAPTMALISATALAAPAGPDWRSRIWIGIDPTRQGLTLRVVSTGCTRREHFAVATNADGVSQVKRLKEDRCRRRPQLIEFHYTFDELGIDGPLLFELSTPTGSRPRAHS